MLLASDASCKKKRGKKPIKSEIFIDPPRKLEKRGETGIERRYHTTVTNVIRAEVKPVPGFKVLFFFGPQFITATGRWRRES